MIPAQKALNLDRFKKGGATGLPTKPNGAFAGPSNRIVEVEKRKNQIIANIENIPSLPSIIFEITRIANSPDSSAKDIEERMKEDQVLTAKLLRVANSSYYALSSRVTNITRAVASLGFNAVKSIVIAASVSASLSKDLGVYGYKPGGLWAHSLACAMVSKAIGKFFKMSDDDVEELFVAGLLHDIGKIAIAPTLEQNKAEVNRLLQLQPNLDLEEIEYKVVGIKHTEVSQVLGAKWNLTEKLVDAITNHHTMTSNQFQGIVLLADYLCVKNKLGLMDTYPWVGTLPEQALSVLKINQETYDKLTVYFTRFIENEVQPLIETMRS